MASLSRKIKRLQKHIKKNASILFWCAVLGWYLAESMDNPEVRVEQAKLEHKRIEEANYKPSNHEKWAKAKKNAESFDDPTLALGGHGNPTIVAERTYAENPEAKDEDWLKRRNEAPVTEMPPAERARLAALEQTKRKKAERAERIANGEEEEDDSPDVDDETITKEKVQRRAWIHLKIQNFDALKLEDYKQEIMNREGAKALEVELNLRQLEKLGKMWARIEQDEDGTAELIQNISLHDEDEEEALVEQELGAGTLEEAEQVIEEAETEAEAEPEAEPEAESQTETQTEVEPTPTAQAALVPAPETILLPLAPESPAPIRHRCAHHK